MKRDDISSSLKSEPSWPAAPEDLAIADDEVHVWRASLDITPGQLERFARILSSDDSRRAESFRLQVNRDRFIAAHGLLRFLLAKYVKLEPEELLFCCGPNGKPALADDSSGALLSFNMSHSYGLALFAVTKGREIGVDLECVRADFPTDEIVQQFFPPEELRSYVALSEHARQNAFFTWWVRNEACLKAGGQGLSADLRHEFDIPLIPSAPDPRIRIMKNRSGSGQYSLSDLNAGDGYAAALAVQGEHRQHRYWQWRHLSN